MSKSLEEVIIDLVELFRPHIESLNSVLDIGTGSSIPIHVFAEIFPQIRFMTIDVTDARQRKKLPFVIYDGISIPFDDLEFEGSVLNETLHHCEEPELVLLEARRVAKSVFVIEHFPSPDASFSELYETEIYALLNFGMNFPLYNPYTEDSLLNLFEKSRLKVLDRIEIPYYGKREIKKYFYKLE